MKDNDIILLFDSRDERALTELRKKYDRYCRTVAFGILNNAEDVEECLNDAYLKVWDNIPPSIPVDLRRFVSSIVRNCAIDRYRANHAGCRIPEEQTVSLEGLDDSKQPATDPWTDPLGLGSAAGETVANGSGTGGPDVAALIAEYLRGLRPEKRRIFFARYYHERSVNDIAEIAGIPKGTVLSTLKRTRDGLRKFLESKGVEV